MAQTGLPEWAILAAWAAAGIISILGAWTVAGLATVTEESGGSYEYLRIGFGNFISFLEGWAEFIIMGSGANAALAFLFAHALGSLTTISNPFESLEHLSIGNFIFPFADSGLKMIGVASIIILTTINYVGTKNGTTLNNIITTVKILGILILIFLGLTYSESIQANIFISSSSDNPSENVFFLSAFFSAMLAAFWAYQGWVTGALISGEIISPKKNVPKAIFNGLLMVIIIYLLLNYAFLKVLSIEALSKIDENEVGAIVFAKSIFGNHGVIMVFVLIVVSVFGALNSSILSFPRKYYRMAQMGYFFEEAKQIHPKYNTPHKAIVFSGIWSCILLISGSFDILTDMVIFTGFIFYALLAVALIKLKRNGTITAKVVGYPFTPILFILFSIALCINTLWVQPMLSLTGIGLILCGIPFYYYFTKQLKTKAKILK